MTDRPDPVTGEDIRGLRLDTQGLKESVDVFATKEELEHERDRRRSGVVIGSVFLLMFLIGGFYVRSVAADARHAVDVSNADRAERTKGSCFQFNINQQNTRHAIINGLVDTFRPLIQPGHEADLEVFAASLKVNVEAQLPYRDCSPDGIAAFLLNPPADPNGG